MNFDRSLFVSFADQFSAAHTRYNEDSLAKASVPTAVNFLEFSQTFMDGYPILDGLRRNLEKRDRWWSE